MDTLSDGQAQAEAFIPISDRDFDNDKSLRSWAVSMAGPQGVCHARVLNHSIGVTIANTGEVVRFTRQTPLRRPHVNKATLLDQEGVSAHIATS